MKLEAFGRAQERLERLISDAGRDGRQWAEEMLKGAVKEAELLLERGIPMARDPLALLLEGDMTGGLFPGSKRDGPVRVLGDFHFALGSAYEALGDTKRAANYLHAAVETYESVDGTEGAERAREKLRTAVAAATGRGDTEVQDDKPRIAIQSEPDEGVFSLAFSQDGRMLAAGSFQGTIKLWDTRSGLVLDTLASHVGKHPAVNFGPKSRTLTVSGDDTTELWSVSGGKLIRSVNGAATFSADEELVASYSSTRYKSDVVNLWDARRCKFLRWLKGHEGPILTVSFSPDHQLLATGGVDRTVRIWDTQRGTLLHTLEGHKADVGVVSFNKDGSEVVSYGDDSISISWDAETGRLLKREQRKNVPDERANSSNGARTTLSPDGRVLADVTGPSPDGRVLDITDRVIELRDAKSRQVIRKLSGSPILPSLVQFSDDGRALVIVNNAYFTMLDLQSGDFIKTEEVRDGGIVDQSEFSPSEDNRDQLSFHIVSPDGRIEIFNSVKPVGAVFQDLRSGHLIRFVPGEIGGAQFSHDGRRVIVGNELRHARTGALIKKFPDAISISFSRDSKIVVGLNYETARNSGIFVADARTGQLILGQRFASAKKSKAFLGFSTIGAVEISNDLKRLAITESGASGSNGSGILFNAETGEELEFISGGNGIFPTTFSPDSRLVAVENNETEINIVDAEDGSLINTLTGHANYIESLDFSPDSKTLVSSSLDGTIKFWNVESRDLLATLLLLEDGNWLAVAPNGLFDGTADAMQQVNWRLGKANEVAPVGWFFNDFFHPGLVAEIMEGGRPKADVDIATMLQLPGLRTMLSQGLARIEKRNGKAVLCFNDKPTATPQVYSDAQPLAFDPNDLTFHEDDAVCRYQKELQDDKQYEVVNAASGKQPTAFKPAYDGEKSKTMQSTLHVLIVGVGKYDLSTSGFKKLPGSVAGAKAVKSFFVEQERRAKKPYHDIRIWPGLYDQDATREKIRQRLADLAKEAKENDVVFLFFSGHGIVPAGQEMFYFAPIDMRGPSPQDQRDTGLSTAMLAETIRELAVNRVVLIIDACQSGGAIESLAKIAEVKAKVEDRRAQIENREKAPKRNRRVGVYIIAAATPLQEAVQPKAGNGALVSTLLETLIDGQSASGEVWIRDLVKRIEQRLPEVSAKIGQRHTPMIVSIGVDFPITYRRVPAKIFRSKSRPRR